MANYDQWSDMPNNFFTKCVPAYDKERTLYDYLELEAYNKFGVQMVYYPVILSGTDPLFGEASNLVISRKFEYMAYYELPDESRTIGIFGITSTDNFKIFVNFIHYNFVSTFDISGTSAGTYPTYLPKIGDLVYAKYNKQFYRINMVKLEDDIFLQGKHTYTFFLENFREKSYTISSELRAIADDPINTLIGDSDIYDQKVEIDLEKQKYLYEPESTECPKQDPFNIW